MKNLTIKMKLIIGFGIVLSLMLVSAVTSFLGISSITAEIDAYGNYTVPNTNYTWTMRKDMASIQRYLLRLLVVKDPAALKAELNNVSATSQALKDMLEVYAKNQRNTDQDNLINTLWTQLSDGAAIRDKYTSLIAEGTDESLNKARDVFLTQYAPLLDKVEATLASVNEAENAIADQQKIDGKATANLSFWLISIVAVISLILTFVILSVILKSILNPVKEIEGVYSEMAKGNMKAEISYDSKDELGNMARSIRRTNAMLASYIRDISDKLSQISRGDMRINVDMDYIGDFAAIKQAIKSTASSLNEIMQTINTAAEQVSTGSEQVAVGAQALATGSTEQASSIEELSVSINKIAEQAAENSANVKVATQYVEQASSGVNAGNEHMKLLSDAMVNIGSASNQITNITKVIEDIAFQTNILALNAAIEAARAGNAGKGFAVVADEVRNLAAKSAEAAKQTAELIQRSAATVSEGTQIAEKTAKILHEVEDKANLANESIVKIDHASNEQAMAIEQIRQGLSQVSAVVQTNAATAEENSATSEEMSAQATTLREEVGRFKLNTSHEKGSASISLQDDMVPPRKAAQRLSGGFGKY